MLAPFRGRSVVSWALEHALAAGLDQTWVVTGAVDLVAAGVVPAGVKVLENPRWAEGQATSLQVAVAAACTGGTPDIGCLVVGLGDQPLVAPEAWWVVASSSGRPIAVGSYLGHRRNPVRIDRECWALLPEEGDAGARVLMRQRPELVMEVACPSDPADIDTVEDLESAAASGGGAEPAPPSEPH